MSAGGHAIAASGAMPQMVYDTANAFDALRRCASEAPAGTAAKATTIDAQSQGRGGQSNLQPNPLTADAGEALPS